MVADLITRIILDDNKFNDTLNRVRKGLDMTGSVTKGITSGLKGMAGQIAAAAGVYEMFNTAVNSNTMAQESWNDLLGTAKESVDSFFTSLSSGDWSMWEKGVTNAIMLSKKYTQALRNMKMAILVGDVKLSTQEKDLNLYENQATDENASAASRESAFAKFKQAGDETIKYVDNLSQYVNGKLREMLEGKGITADKNVRNLIFKYLDPSTDGAKLLEEYTNLQQEIKKNVSVANSIATNQFEIEAKGNAEEKLPILRKQMAELTAMYPELEQAFRLKLNFGTQEELDQLFDVIDRIVGYEDRLESARRQIRDVAKDFDKNGKLIASSTSGDGKSNPLFPKGSIAELEKRISDLKTKLKLEVDPQSRIGLESEIRRIENEKHVIEFQYQHTDPGKVSERGIPNFASLAGMPGLKIDKPIERKDIKLNTEYAESIMTIAGSMATLSGSFESGTAGMLQYFTNIVSGAAQAAAAIAALIPVKKAEANANMEAAVTGAAASQSFIPFAGPAMAISAVMSLIAAMASIPKFANGGIVGGHSFTGDKLLARVNSGEMILNVNQQNALLQSSQRSDSISQSQEIKIVSEAGEARVRGADIYISLKNYMTKNKLKL